MALTFVVGILHKDGEFLVEQRKLSEDYFPGAILFPGGHIDNGEAPEHALVRELKEELGITVLEQKFIGEFTHPDGAMNLTYLVTKWDGNPSPLEAEQLLWIKDHQRLTNQLDHEMLKAAQSVLESI